MAADLTILMGMGPVSAAGRRSGDARAPLRLQRSFANAPRRLLVVGVSAIALVLLVAFAQMIRSAERAGRDSLDERAVQRTVIAQRFIEAYNTDLKASIRSHAEQALAEPAPTPEVFTLVNEMMRFRAGVLLDADGRVLQTYPTDPALVGTDLTGRNDHLRRAVSGQEAVTGVVPSAVGGDPIVAFAVPFETASGRRVFSAGYRAEDSPLGAYLLNATVVPGEALYLVDDLGNIIASSAAVVAPTLAAQDPDLARVATATGRGTYTADGVDAFFSAQAIEGAPWRLVRAVPTEAMYAPAAEGRWIPWVLFAGFVTVGVASVVMLNWIMGQRDHERRRGRRDALTGLANRRSLDLALAERLRGPVDAAWAVLMVDVDHFKQVNDEHGHQRGDEVLVAVATAIVESVRPTDVVGRWGGEEFMVVVPGASLATASELAERIGGTVGALRVGTIAVTVSIGFASTETAPADGLVDLADASLYRAKQTGRNRSLTLTPGDAFPAMAADPTAPEPRHPGTSESQASV